MGQKRKHGPRGPGPQQIDSELPSMFEIASVPQRSSTSIVAFVRNSKFQKSFQLIFLAAVYSPLSQLNLSPVYGSIPSGLYHRYGFIVSVLLAFGLRGRLPPWISRIIPTFCFWIPSIQFVLFQFSSSLGPTLGPVITELLTYHPLLILSMYTGTQLLEEVIQPEPTSTNPLAEATPSMGLFLLFAIIQRSAKSWLTNYIGRHFLLSRIGLQLTIAALYTLILPISTTTFWPALPSIAFTMVANPHTPLVRTTDVLNNTLALSNFTLLERTESVTGYISVLESHSDPSFRVLRCDHSLLGGNWLLPPRPHFPGLPPRLVSEPIYAVFTMLEAVRLVDPPPLPSSPSHPHKALVIGLGIGTAPTALLHHNINTTILELDPAIHHFAVKYFSLPPQHSYLIGDAISAVTASANNPAHHNTYTYILHDVFTGGAEPASLFTTEFLTSLSLLLTIDGVIAINYAADLSHPSTSVVYRTITSVFGRESCRVFREEPPLTADSDTHAAKAGVDFTNMVFFCRNNNPHNQPKPPQSQSSSSSASPQDPLPLKFRTPTEADFLGSSARKSHLLPRYEVSPSEFTVEGEVLSERNLGLLERTQGESALGHWRVMRGVLPKEVWEGW